MPAFTGMDCRRCSYYWFLRHRTKVGEYGAFDCRIGYFVVTHKHMTYGVCEHRAHIQQWVTQSFILIILSNKKFWYKIVLKSKGLEKILIKYIQISKQIYSDKLFQVVSFWHTNLRSYQTKNQTKNFKSISPNKNMQQWK